MKTFFIAAAIVSLATSVYAENWIDFYTEKWSRQAGKSSGKSSGKLQFRNRYFYDGESLVKSPSDDVTLWVKVISDNDSYYVKKGVPQSETVYQRIHIWCTAKRYQLLEADTDSAEPAEVLSEEIKGGSYYGKLYKSVCN